MTSFENLTSALAKLSEVAQTHRELLVQKQLQATAVTEKTVLVKLKAEAIERNAEAKIQENIQTLIEICDKVLTESSNLVNYEKVPEEYSEEMTKTVKIFEQISKIIRVRNNLSGVIYQLPLQQKESPIATEEPKKSCVIS